MKLNYRRTFLIGLAFLSISGFWQMYDSIIPLILQNTFHLGEAVTGVLMAMDNVLAVFLLPVLGALSDRTDTRIGKRMPFILAGTFLALCFLFLLPVADRRENLILFIAALFGLLLSMGLYRSPAVALMPDLTPGRLRSRANAVINLMGAVGGVYALLMIKLLVGKGARPDYLPLFISIGGLMLVAVAVLFFTVNEKRTAAIVAEELRSCGAQAGAAAKVQNAETAQAEESGAETAQAGEGGARTETAKSTGITGETGTAEKNRMDPAVKRSLGFLLVSIFFWFTAYNAVTTAFSRYTRVVWHMEGGSFADCLMVATVAAIISYIPIGNIASRVGRKKTILAGIVLMSVCYLAAVFVGSYHPLINVAFAVIGVGWAAINVNSYPMIVEMAKGGDIGRYTGTYYTFSMAAQIATPILSGFLLQHVSYRTLFPYAFLFSVAAFLTMLQVKHGDLRPEKKKDRLENFDV